MSAAIEYIEDDDLAMFALGLLAPAEAAAIARAVSEDAGTRMRLAEARAQMGAYLESQVVLDEVPEQSLDRLMGRIAEERKVAPMRPAGAAPRFGILGSAEVSGSAKETTADRRFGVGRAMPWVGWAAAAGLAVAAGTLYRERAGLEGQLVEERGQVAQVSNETAEAARERDALRAGAAEQGRKVEDLTAAQQSAQAAAAEERERAAGQTEAARAEAERARAAGAATMDQEQARVNALTAQLAEAQRQQAVLQGQVSAETATVATQTGELDRLRAEAAGAREVMEALTDRTALRVTLTRPKGTPEPTGRATYVASRGTLVFQGSSLAALAANKVYELWLLPADGGAPVAAGTFAPDARGNATLVTAKLPGAVAAKAFAITVENEGGAATPTMPILLVGAAG